MNPESGTFSLEIESHYETRTEEGPSDKLQELMEQASGGGENENKANNDVPMEDATPSETTSTALEDAPFDGTKTEQCEPMTTLPTETEQPQITATTNEPNPSQTEAKPESEADAQPEDELVSTGLETKAQQDGEDEASKAETMPLMEAVPVPNEPTAENGVSSMDIDSTNVTSKPQSDTGGPAVEQSPLVREQLKYFSSILRSLRRNKDAGPFLAPVDATALNIPDYHNVIKQPMDLGTIGTKLAEHAYSNVESAVADVKLMFENCYTYNAANTVVHNMGRNLEKAFDNMMKKMPTEASLAAASQKRVGESPNPSRAGGTEISERARRSSAMLKRRYDSPEFDTPPSKKASYTDLRHGGGPKTPSRKGSMAAAFGPGSARKSASSSAALVAEDLRHVANIIRDFFKKQYQVQAWPFLQPVDPVALNIPDYFTVIKRPMDLSSIKNKIELKVYAAAEDIEADFRLMCSNCYTYNGVDSDVAKLCQQLEHVFSTRYAQRPSQLKGTLSYGAFEDEDLNGGGDSLADIEHRLREKQRQLKLLEAEIADLQAARSHAQKKRGGSGLSTPGRATPGRSHGHGSASSTGGAGSLGAGASSKKKSSTSTRQPPLLDFEQKRQLSYDINELDQDKLVKVLDIINESMPNLKNTTDGDEIELDIEQLDAATLWKLSKFIRACKAADVGAGLSSYPHHHHAADVDLSSDDEEEVDE